MRDIVTSTLSTAFPSSDKFMSLIDNGKRSQARPSTASSGTLGEVLIFRLFVDAN